MSMDRRDFLKLLGAAGAAAAVGPATVFPAAAQQPELLVTRYRMGPLTVKAPMQMVSGLILEAPEGQRCRALIETHEGVFAQVHRVRTWNDLGISIAHLGQEGDISQLVGPVDSRVFGEGADIPPVVAINGRALQVDYERSPNGAPDLLLMLEYHAGSPVESCDLGGFPKIWGAPSEG